MGKLPVFFFFLFSLIPSSQAQQTPSISREFHWAVTSEKFELALERWRVEKKARYRAPVVLSHGLLVNSHFLNLDEDQSLMRHLANEGFDVWNLSLRGTGRSLKPLKGGPQVWTLDDIIERDLSAVLRYVQKESRSSKVIWIGYEMGGLLLYGYLARKKAPEVFAGVTIGAPVSFNHPDQEPVKKLLKLEESPRLKRIVLYLNAPFLGRLLIPMVPKIERLFYNPENIENDTKEKLLQGALVEMNPGVLDHFLLMLKRGEFVSARGDFSYRKNLGKIRTPLLLIGGEADPLAPPETIRAAYRAVGSSDRTLRIFGSGSKDSADYGHFDLILGKNAKQEVFSFITRWLKKRDGQE